MAGSGCNSLRANKQVMNTLIIGGAGYIGAHLAALLQTTGRQVTVVGRKPVPSHALPAETVYIAADFSRQDVLCQLLDRHQEVIHLAYATLPNTSFENPLSDLLQNLPPTVQLFEEVAARGSKLVLVSSGGTVYGEAVVTPIDEQHPTKPISPYGVSKLTLENYAYLYAVTHGLKFVCVRPANAYGEGQRPFIGQGFISTAMAAAMRGQPVKIFGSTGTVRDYLHVSDLAAGIAHALDKGTLSTIYNIGSGVGLSNMDIVDAISPLLHEMGCVLKIEHMPERIFDVKVNILDASRLRSHTGWEPRVTLTQGLLRTRNWLRHSNAW